MEERESLKDNPTFITANSAIRKELKILGSEHVQALKEGDLDLADDLVKEARTLKREAFPFKVIRGGKVI